MAISYQEALNLFGITEGFVDEQIDFIFEALKENHNPDKFPFMSPEYKEASDKRREVKMAYSTLKSSFRNYIVSKNFIDNSTRENMNDQILKLVYDHAKGGKNIDEYFISDLVEIIVCNRNLNDYVKQISFETTRMKNKIAAYGIDNNLKVYSPNIYDEIRNSYIPGLETLEKRYEPYCQVVNIIGHEIEHANQKRLRTENDLDDIKTKILLACNYFQAKTIKDIENIEKLPAFLHLLSSIKLLFLTNLYRKKYHKYWLYSPVERLAEFSGTNLSLDLIQNLHENLAMPLPTLEKNFMISLVNIILGVYRVDAPTIYYLEKLKQYEDSLTIKNMSRDLSLEERVILGLEVYPEEMGLLLCNGEKIIQKIRSL